MNSIIQTPTPNLEQSLDFYKKLNFEKLPAASGNFVTDGKVVIEINPDGFARAGVKLFKNSWQKVQ